MPDDTDLILLYEGVSGLEALGALAALRAGGRRAELISHDAIVQSREGARLVPDRLGYDHVPTAPAVVLPHGAVDGPLADAALARALRARRGHFILASGDAIRLVAAAGLAEDRRVARMPGDADIPGATSVHARLVADARLLTCFPGDPLIDLALHFVGHEHGDPVAERAAHALGREYRPYAYGETVRGAGPDAS